MKIYYSKPLSRGKMCKLKYKTVTSIISKSTYVCSMNMPIFVLEKGLSDMHDTSLKGDIF